MPLAMCSTLHLHESFWNLGTLTSIGNLLSKWTKKDVILFSLMPSLRLSQLPAEPHGSDSPPAPGTSWEAPFP